MRYELDERGLVFWFLAGVRNIPVKGGSGLCPGTYAIDSREKKTVEAYSWLFVFF
jgi:hypothetical protein